MCKMEGKHKKHKVLSTNESKDFLKTSLEEKMGFLESESKTIECFPEKIEEELENIRKTKGQIKETITNKFNEIRRALDEREEKMLRTIEESYLKEEEQELDDLASSTEDALTDISSRHSEGQNLLDKWDSANNIPKAGNILKSINTLLEENRKLKKLFSEMCGCRVFSETTDFVDGANEIVKLVNAPREFRVRRIPEHGPCNLVARVIGPSYVTFEWCENEKYDKGYTIKIQKEGDGEPGPDSFIDITQNRYTAKRLEENTTYKINVRAKRGAFVSKWSDLLSIKTTVPTIEDMVNTLREYRGVNATICAEALYNIEGLVDYRTIILITQLQ